MSGPTKESDGGSDEAQNAYPLDRDPRPYFRDRLHIPRDEIGHFSGNRESLHLNSQLQTWEQQPSGEVSTAVSESGTEADDEKPSFVKALPPATVRPRKGLKTGEQNEDALLTPSQLDDEGRRLDGDYWNRSQDGHSTEEQKAEQEKLLRRRLAEFARRTSEVGLMFVMLLCVLYGKGVWQQAVLWKWELLCHFLTIAVLILAYPLKLSIVDTQATHNRVWERFRVPASFDPATVLYPPLLPVLVALSVSPSNPGSILPNMILGLASLPQRLFPRTSRLGGFNALHWLVSVLPMLIPGVLGIRQQPLAGLHLTPEALMSLYPLHYALLQPLHYLTRTSLLISELHLLSAALINLLLLAQSPQIVILKACLWVGGATALIFCAPVLHWNLVLARIPKWKFRRPGHTAEERKSLVDAVSDIISLQRAAGAFKSACPPDSDADEDEPALSIKEKVDRSPSLNGNSPELGQAEFGTSSEMRRWNSTQTAPSKSRSPARQSRRTTLPLPEDNEISRRHSRRSRGRSTLSWYLQLTAEQAERRKLVYASYVYACLIVIILGPVQDYAWRKALNGHNPIAWAVTYMAGQLPVIRDILTSTGLSEYLPWPPAPGDLAQIAWTIPFDASVVRIIVGAANVRVLLIAYWAFVLLLGLLAVFSLTAYVEVDTRRKVFHGVMVAMLLPSIFIDPCCCALALAIILAVFLLLEVIRAGQVPPLGKAISRFVAPYVDGRDLRGPVVVSHIFLLVGCAVPLWFSLASIPRAGGEPWVGWELVAEQREVAMVAGVVCVGMGDAAASLIGRRYGRHKWVWVGGKSLEGSAAFAVAVTVGLMAAKVWQVVGSWPDVVHGDISFSAGFSVWGVSLLKAAFCACGASFMEAVLTGANDNVVVPIALWLLVKGIRL